jgi:amino acid adenylation domain-containing protein
MDLNLAYGIYKNSIQYPQELAISVAGKELTYAQLRERVQPIAGWLWRNCRESAPRVAILSARTLSTYIGILGASWAGGTYVPVSTKLPEDRLIQLLDRVQAAAMIVDADTEAQLTPRVLAHCPKLILSPEREKSSELKTPGGGHVALTGRDALPEMDSKDTPANVGPEHVVYIIFTSGTTGIPKGVMIQASAVAHFVAVMQARYGLTPADRVAGMTEITFDISVFDLFVVWNSGASLHVVPQTQLMAPASFVKRTRCTIIFTVPSVASAMQRMKMLAPGSLPGLRYSFFAGEPLPVLSATVWKDAAPNSIVEDLFGPTEATVVCIGQRFEGPQNATPNRGVVAIGTPFAGMQAAIVDSDLVFLPNGEQGELLLGGPQLSNGYFGAEDQTKVSFPVLRGTRWYRTGDLAYCDAAGIFHHLGRIDNQVKVRGLRVELEEIEGHLREVYRTDAVAAVAWPVEHGSANGIVAFVSGQSGADDPDVKEQIKSRLPSYMVPTRVHCVEALPLNANGKVNRKQLVTLLDEGKF